MASRFATHNPQINIPIYLENKTNHPTFAPKPKLVLADEPTGNLDAATGHQIIELMFAINAESGTTLILVTHDEEIAARCVRRMRMHAGELEEIR